MFLAIEILLEILVKERVEILDKKYVPKAQQTSLEQLQLTWICLDLSLIEKRNPFTFSTFMPYHFQTTINLRTVCRSEAINH